MCQVKLPFSRKQLKKTRLKFVKESLLAKQKRLTKFDNAWLYNCDSPARENMNVNCCCK